MLNLLPNAMSVTKEELTALANRREAEILEFEFTLQQMKTKVIMSQFDEYYCLDIEWYFQWKAYVFNDISEKNILRSKMRISENSKIGKLIYN